jgi:hypothetical protein
MQPCLDIGLPRNAMQCNHERRTSSNILLSARSQACLTLSFAGTAGSDSTILARFDQCRDPRSDPSVVC